MLFLRLTRQVLLLRPAPEESSKWMPPLAQMDFFLREMLLSFEMSNIEMRVQDSGKLPSFEEYWQRRMGSSAVGTCLVLNECASSRTQGRY